jgi:hypothetical protein
MKKDLLLSLAAIEAAPKRSVGIADSAVQMFTKGLLLMLRKNKNWKRLYRVLTLYTTANGAKKPPLGLLKLLNNLKRFAKTLTAVANPVSGLVEGKLVLTLMKVNF